MSAFTRVRDKATGHEYDLPPSAFDEDAHEKVESEDYPDIEGERAEPRPPTLAGSKKAASTTTSSRARTSRARKSTKKKTESPATTATTTGTPAVDATSKES